MIEDCERARISSGVAAAILARRSCAPFRRAPAQDWFKTGTGLGVTKARRGRAGIRDAVRGGAAA